SNKGISLSILGRRLDGDVGVQALTASIAAYDQALEVYTEVHHAFRYAAIMRNRELAQRLLEEKGR
ncbi:MAG: hypothetical protein O7D33_04870, partial [Chloroflexi bacterium]|nr:hypothetical protein [Chloroflexota bacterium]